MCKKPLLHLAAVISNFFQSTDGGLEQEFVEVREEELEGGGQRQTASIEFELDEESDNRNSATCQTQQSFATLIITSLLLRLYYH